MRRKLAIVLIILLVLTACGRIEPGTSTAAQATTSAPGPVATSSTTAAAPARPLVDPQHPPAVAGQDGYAYQQVATADFDGDGVEERAFLIANAAVENGQPLWDDGHVWQLYIEEPTGERTYLFARFVQLGIVEAKLTQSEAGEPPQILLVERWPSSFHVYELRYRGPATVEARVLVERELVRYPDGFVQP